MHIMPSAIQSMAHPAKGKMRVQMKRRENRTMPPVQSHRKARPTYPPENLPLMTLPVPSDCTCPWNIGAKPSRLNQEELQPTWMKEPVV